MKAMEIGDLAFFYHSVNEKQIVGIVEVIELYPDPTDASGRFGVVTVKAVMTMARPVTLPRSRPRNAFPRWRWCRSRLSVTPVSADQWTILMEMGETAPAGGVATVRDLSRRMDRDEWMNRPSPWRR